MLLQSKHFFSKLIISLLSYAHWPFLVLTIQQYSSKSQKKPVFNSVSSPQMVYIQIYTLQTNITTKVASLKIRNNLNIFLKITPIPNNIYIYIQSYHQRISLQSRLYIIITVCKIIFIILWNFKCVFFLFQIFKLTIERLNLRQ